MLVKNSDINHTYDCINPWFSEQVCFFQTFFQNRVKISLIDEHLPVYIFTVTTPSHGGGGGGGGECYLNYSDSLQSYNRDI